MSIKQFSINLDIDTSPGSLQCWLVMPGRGRLVDLQGSKCQPVYNFQGSRETLQSIIQYWFNSSDKSVSVEELIEVLEPMGELFE